MAKAKKQPERVHCKECIWWGPEEDKGQTYEQLIEDLCHINASNARYEIKTKADYWCGQGSKK